MIGQLLFIAVGVLFAVLSVDLHGLASAVTLGLGLAFVGSGIYSLITE